MKLKLNDVNGMFSSLKIVMVIAVVTGLILLITIRNIYAFFGPALTVGISGFVVVAFLPLHKKVVNMVDVEGDSNAAKKFAALYTGIFFLAITALITYIITLVLHLHFKQDIYLFAALVTLGTAVPCYFQYKLLFNILRNQENCE